MRDSGVHLTRERWAAVFSYYYGPARADTSDMGPVPYSRPCTAESVISVEIVILRGPWVMLAGCPSQLAWFLEQPPWTPHSRSSQREYDPTYGKAFTYCEHDPNHSQGQRFRAFDHPHNPRYCRHGVPQPN